MISFLYGLLAFTVIGLATEAVFNGVREQIIRRLLGQKFDWLLPCKTWIWSILVFGLSAAIGFPVLSYVWPEFFHQPWLFRGAFYAVGIYFWEYFWGAILEKLLGQCPWQYESSPLRIWRVIRPRYFAYWFIYGFAMEWTHLTLVPLLVKYA